MDQRAVIARLVRRIAWGTRTGELAGKVEAGVDAMRSALLVEPGRRAASDPREVDPWEGLELTVARSDTDRVRQVAALAIQGWVQHMVAAPSPLVDRMAWLWHGHFVSSLREVRDPEMLVNQIRLFRRSGLGSFADLVRSVTIDAAMLMYLNGDGSDGRAPNENYSREVLELFTLGRGNYTEDDIVAGAHALSGWKVLARFDRSVRFVRARHDDTSRRYLGVDGVHDVDSVVDAIMGHPAAASFVARMLTYEFVGPNAPASAVSNVAEQLGARWSLGDAMTAVIDEMVAGIDGGPVVLGPVPWLVQALRATSATLAPRVALSELRASGQVPLVPSNVGGWPSGSAWYATAPTVARFNLASAIAEATPEDSPLRNTDDVGELSWLLGLGTPFSRQTAAALSSVTGSTDRLVLALTSPEFTRA